MVLASGLAIALVSAFGGVAAAAGPEDLGRPAGYVTDAAGVLDADSKQRIEEYLGRVERELHVQFAVAIVPTVAPKSPEE